MFLYNLENIRCIHAGREVLHIDELGVERGGILGVAGPNGSGKSTLMRLLALIDLADQGTVTFDGNKFGREIGDAGAATTRLWKVRRQIAMLSQETYLLKRSVAANLAYGIKLRVNLDAEELHTKQCAALEAVGLAPEKYLRRSWRELSGGESQRTALAARLILKPQVLLLDEPTASLDEESTELIRHAATEARKRDGTTLVVVSHDLPWLEGVSDKIVRLRHGVIIA